MSDSNSIIPFSYHEHQIRTVIRDGEPWFVATDVAKVLNHSNASKMIESLDDDEKSTITSGYPKTVGNPTRAIVSESGLYRILMRSDKPEARPF